MTRLLAHVIVFVIRRYTGHVNSIAKVCTDADVFAVASSLNSSRCAGMSMAIYACAQQASR